ncbi:MAG: diaminopimelate epimerase [Micrococcales bacterium]|nr:diaminopimelate epimerase [Micrococcales bacterium]
MSHLSFAKGHGTENDFIVIRDRHNLAPLTPELVRAICDRHAGIGSDGLVRAVKAGCIPEWSGDPSLWFMDYWNPDGSLAEMCGNALRVFVRYLIEEDLVPRSEVPIATRAGLRTVWEQPGGALRTAMGPVAVGQPTWVEAGGARFEAMSANVGNPHAVAVLPAGADLDGIDLRDGVVFDTALFPEGVNTEFVRVVGPGHIKLRVFERGAGETRSCGTGVVASAAVARRQTGNDGPWTVDVPGGRLSVDFDGAEAFLTGPAVIIARGDLVMPD